MPFSAEAEGEYWSLNTLERKRKTKSGPELPARMADLIFQEKSCSS